MTRAHSGDAEVGRSGGTLTAVSPTPDSESRLFVAPRRQGAMALRRMAGGVAIVGALLMAGCGGDESSAAGDPATAARSDEGAPLDAEAAAGIDLKVVADGSQVALADVAATDRPTLLWFWAPF